MEDTKIRPSRAPNTFIILLWHHFCYYKRHPILFVISILMPFALLSALYFLVYELSSTSDADPRLGRMGKQLPCQQQTRPFLSSGPFHYASAHTCLRTQQSISSYCNDGYACGYPSQQCVNETIYVEGSLSDHQPFCPVQMPPGAQISIFDILLLAGDDSPNSTRPSTRPPTSAPYRPTTVSSTRCQCRNINSYNLVYDRCSWLRGHVVYYPNNSRAVQQIMAGVKSQIDAYGDFINQVAGMSEIDLRKEIGNLPVQDFRQLVEYASCFEPSEQRVLGFRTREDMLLYVKYLNDSFDPYDSPRYYSNWPSQILWAAINFEPITNQSINDQKPIKYSILRESKFATSDEKKAIFIQDLIESAIVKSKLNTTGLPVVPMLKELPSKCWIRNNSVVYVVLTLLLPICCVLSFLFAPVNFLEQVITEKQLKLREYLSITGVNDLTLKLSWIIFYMIFILPASIGAAVYVQFFYGGAMASTELSILIVQFVLYNLSQLFLSYFLSSFLKEPKRVTFILGFFNTLPSSFAVCAYHFGGNQLRGAFLIVFRIASLHCAVPFVLSLCYTVHWETFWIGGKWKHFFHSPVLSDGYYGFGEGILWMLGDCVLYLIGAWYLQNVMPGEYGVKRKWYFFVQPSYWMPKTFKDAELDPNEIGQLEMDQLKPDLEPRPDADSRKATLVIDRLTKFYNRQKMGVDRLLLSIYKGEITSLLGQNGAGKSTTMNTIVGLLSPTSGRFEVAGLDCASQMNEIKKVLGFVPQYDILYPSMTVEEHLQFFGWLKGMNTKEIKSEVYPILDKFGMSHLKKTITTNLSGGQKRKLSILTAYLGNPELVILDEPTTGVDPFSRRSIWDVLFHHRPNTATIVSTHFMDEADMLSDRIAVISEGTLRCVGTPMYLKQKYGQGYRIIAACKDEQGAIDKAKMFFSNRSTDEKINIELSQVSGRDLTFTVPKEYARSRNMVELLRSIEDQRHQTGIGSFGISEPTLEEAFFAAAQVDVKTRSAGEEHQKNGTMRGDHATSAKLKYTNRLGVGLWFYQFFELLKKRAILTIRTPTSVAMQILLPLAFVIILLLVSNAITESKSAQLSPIHIYQPFRQNVLFFQDKSADKASGATFQSLIKNGLSPRCPDGIDGFKCGQSISDQPISINIPDTSLSVPRDSCLDCNSHCQEGNARQLPHWTTPSMDLIYGLPPAMNTADWILAANQSDHAIVGGFQLHTSSMNFSSDRSNLSAELAISTPLSYMVVWSRPDSKMAMLNAFNNLILRTYSTDPTATIQLSYEDLHFPSPEDDNPSRTNVLNIIGTFASTLLLILAFTYATFGIAVTVQQEKAANLKELQYVSGAKPSAYWLANFIWDFVQFLLAMAVLMFFLGVVDNSLRSFLNEYVNVIIPYGMSAIGFVYLISFRFKSSNGVNKVIVLCGVLSLAFAPIICTFEYNNYTETKWCQKSGISAEMCKARYGWSVFAGYVLRLIPYYALADGCYLVCIVHAIGSGPPGVVTESVDIFQTELLGKRIVEGYVMAALWMLVLIFLEYQRNGLCGCGGGKSAKVADVESRPNESPQAQDPDVQAEERRVLQDQALSDPVVVKQVTKRYPKAELPAVDAVTFSIPRSQCFGLLGINGAGKTSLFRIMTGFQPPTSGQALIEGRNVVSEKLVLASNISYCPQENTLFDELSIREHLRLFASFRGIPKANLESIIESLIKEVGLEEHAHKLSKQLSGGNKRKLNFALALLDYKPVVFLDEPTSGMDPGARRRTWTCIQNAIDQGCSVVLTSHSMDECEALCHRLVIMARGKICCIGSIQYLKDKFGNRYTVKIKLTNHKKMENRSQAIDRVKQQIATSLFDSHLIEEHETMLQYEVGAGANGLRLSTLFGTLSELRNSNPDLIEDFTLSQVTLERVFVSMAQRQQDRMQGQSATGPAPSPVQRVQHGGVGPTPVETTKDGLPGSLEEVNNNNNRRMTITQHT